MSLSSGSNRKIINNMEITTIVKTITMIVINMITQIWNNLKINTTSQILFHQIPKNLYLNLNKLIVIQICLIINQKLKLNKKRPLLSNLFNNLHNQISLKSTK